MGRIALHLLGGVEARTDHGAPLGLPTQKYKALLAFLAMPCGRWHARDGLVALLWGDLPHEQARGALRQALWALRRTLNRDGEPALLLDADRVALDPAAVRVDAVEFEQAASRSEPASLIRAAALYRGDFLAGLAAREPPFEEWLARERERLAELALTTLARLLAHQRASGAHDEAVQTALRLLTLDPLQEVVHRSLMQLYVQLGRRGAALRQYQSCVHVLQRELGVEPEPETRALYQEVLRQRVIDPGLREVERPAARRPPAAAPVPPTAALDTPLIGREHELTLLRDVLSDVRAGRGQVVAVLGEAGIGKSRLVAELMAEAGAGGARVVLGRAHESDQVLPLAPWADALRGTGLTDDPAVLTALGPGWQAEVARLVPELGGAEPVAARGAYDYAQLFEAVARLVTALTARSPLVLTLEDLHWADDMSLRLVTFVARRLQGRLPALFLLTARAEELDAAPSLRQTLEDLDRDLPVLELALGPLAREDTARLVSALGGSRPDRPGEPSRGERIWVASQGHPFMVVEMVRAGVEPSDPEAPGLPLPQRVRRLIERRLRRLGPAAQQLVATAAVIGRDFEYALLQPASGVSEEEAIGGLEELVRRRVLHALGDRFEFTHDRLREVAEALLLPPRRKLLHRRVAETLESLKPTVPNEVRAAIGVHYAEAEVWDRAAPLLYEAAQVAWGRSAFREGVVLLERALDALARLPRDRDVTLLEIDIRLRLYRCLFPLGDDRAAEHVARAQALVAEEPDERREAVILVSVSEQRRSTMELEPALRAAEQALALATRTAQPRLIDQAHFQLGVAHLAASRYQEAIAHFEATIDRLATAPLADRLGYPYVPALCRLSWSLTDLGDVAEAGRRAQEAMRVAEAGEHVLSLTEAGTAMGLLHLAEGRPGDAIPALERASELARTWHIAHVHAFSSSSLALAYAACGRLAEAGALLDECERDRVWEHVRVYWSRLIVRLGRGRLLLGDTPRARTLADRGLALARSIGQPAGEAEALALLAEIAVGEGPAGASEAARYQAQAEAIADRVGLRPLQAWLRRRPEEPGRRSAAH